MQIRDYLVQIYSTQNFFNHLTLFSLLGLFVIFLNNLVATIGANLITFNLIAVPPSTKLELYLDLFFVLFLGVYLYGYDYSFIHSNFCSNEVKLPKFDMKTLYYVIKTTPLVLFIFVPYILFILFGFLFIQAGFMYRLIFFGSMLFCLPFFHIVVINFAKTFKYDIENFNLVQVFRNVLKYFFDIVKLNLALFIMSIFLILVNVAIVKLSMPLSTIVRLSSYLLLACFDMYLLTVVKFYYLASLVRYIQAKQE